MLPHAGPAEISGQDQSGAPSRHDLVLEAFLRIGDAENLALVGIAAAGALAPHAVSYRRRSHLEGWLLAENLVPLIVASHGNNESRNPCAALCYLGRALEASCRIWKIENLTVAPSADTAIPPLCAVPRLPD